MELKKAWRGSGDCRECVAKYRCRRSCERRQDFQARMIRRALWMQADKNNAPFREGMKEGKENGGKTDVCQNNH